MALEQEYLLKQEEAEETYQKKLTAGSGININPTTNVISATGGGGSSVTYTSEYPQGETIGILEINDVQNPIQMPELIPGDNVTITQDVTTGALTIDSTGGGNVDDVKIGNTSIVDANKIANIPTMTGATSQAAGSAGVVPAPLATDIDKFLKADGTWDDCSSATELTKAQYDALPSSKESDGVLYMINDIDTTSGTTSDLTRAAYDLLPASKESDDIFYYIIDEGVIMHNGVQYAGGGSGGSSVIANPSGTPTDTLQTVEIDGTIYEIEGGAGGSGELTEVDLWVNTTGVGVGDYTLSQSIDNFDFIAIYYAVWSEYIASPQYADYRLVTVKDLNQLHTDGKKFLITGFTNRTTYTDFNGTDFSITNIENGNTVIKVRGIKIDSAGSSGISSEIIEIATGDGTTSRTFTFSQTPKRIGLNWYEGDDADNWASSYTFIWGDHRAYGFGGNTNSATSGQYPKVASITYGQDGKSFTITAANPGSACNSNGVNDHGYLWADYGTGGSGSDVEANPQDTPTDTLETIKIGNTVYDIAGKGNAYSETILFENTTTSAPSQILLSDDYTKYDLLYFYIIRNADNRNYEIGRILDVSQLTINDYIQFLIYSNEYMSYTITNTTTLDRVNNRGNVYIYRIIGLKMGGGGSSLSEIIPITAGTDTTSRTFTFNKTPKFVKFYYEDPLLESGWCTDATLVWGQTHMNYISNYLTTSYTSLYGGVTSITYGQDGKSFTITGGNAFGAMNTSNGAGYMYIEYESSSGSGSEDIEDMTWTLLTSTTGTGASTAIPSGTKRLVVLIKCAGKVQIVGNESLAAINKVLDITGESNYILGGHWIDQSSSNYGDNTCVISNGSVTAYSSYNTITTYVYALS